MTKQYDRHPPGKEHLRLLIEEVTRAYKRDHPEEAEELDDRPSTWYGPPERGLLRIGKSVFVVRNNQVVGEIRRPGPGGDQHG